MRFAKLFQVAVCLRLAMDSCIFRRIRRWIKRQVQSITTYDYSIETAKSSLLPELGEARSRARNFKSMLIKLSATR